MEKKFFGTDGIRGFVGKSLTFDFAFQLGLAYGSLIEKELPIGEKHKILIGLDTRESCSVFEERLSEALSYYNFDIILLGVTPTPSVSYLTRHLNADGAIMISASHNPYHDNGIKFFTKEGTKISDSFELLIEDALNLNFHTNIKIGTITSLENSDELYADFIVSKFKNRFINENKRIVIDCSNGATYKVAPLIFSHFNFNTEFIHNEPNGININENCGSTHTKSLSANVNKKNADFGIAYDGDGDRLAIVDSFGKEILGDELLYLFTRYLVDTKKLKNKKIAATVVSNLGLEVSLSKIGIPVEKTNVGDKYIMEALRNLDLNFGGESSGHILFFDEHVTGDGILASLFFCLVADFYGNKLDNLRKEFITIPQFTKNLHIEDKYSWQNDSFINEVISNIETEIRTVGRLLIRPSGTEPIVRIMVEHPNILEAERICIQISTIIENKYSKKTFIETE